MDAGSVGGGLGFRRDGHDSVEGGFGFILAVEEQGPAVGAPRHAVVHAPEGDDLDRVLVLDEEAKQVRPLLGSALVGLGDEFAGGGGGVFGDFRAGVALAAGGAVDVEFGNVDGQAEGFQLGEGCDPSPRSSERWR